MNKKIMFLVLSIFTILSTFNPVSAWEDEDVTPLEVERELCGSWQICLSDDYGDGWNGGMVSVYVNGNEVLDDVTLSTGNGPECYTFYTDVGDIVSCAYTPGNGSYENEYYILDQNLNEVAREGAGGVEPGDISSLEACASCRTPINLDTSDISQTAATLNRTELGSSTLWDIELVHTGANFTGNPTVSDISSIPYTLAGLSPNTTYDWKARSNCGASNSEWSSPHTFSTILDGISGDVSGTWTLENSPYNISGDITVQSGTNLEIEPGVNVVFDGSYRFDILGSLNAVGTQEENIVFTANNQAEGWLGLNFQDIQVPSELKYCTIEYGNKTSLSENGGGIYIANCGINLNVELCTIQNNSAVNGGGIYVHDASPTLKTLLITQNISLQNGGGLAIDDESNSTLHNSIISENTAGGNGGGIYVQEASPTLKNLQIVLNTSTLNGGGLAVDDESNLTLRNSTIRENTSDRNGGGIHVEQAFPTLKNLQIVQNFSALNGGGLAAAAESNLTLHNSTISENASGGNGGGIYVENCNELFPMVNSSIVWGNYPDVSEISLESANIEVAYSDVYLVNGIYPGNGNLNENPNFINTNYYRIALMNIDGTDVNPLIDAGDPTLDYNFEPLPNGNRINIGAWGGTSYAAHTAIVYEMPLAPTIILLDDPVVYIFNGPPPITDGYILQIESGSQIALNFDALWDISGVLEILDTGGDPVLITHLDNFNANGDSTTWQGIRLLPNTMRTPSQLNNVEIKNAVNGIYSAGQELSLNGVDISYEDQTGSNSSGFGLQSVSSSLNLDNISISGYAVGINVDNSSVRETIDVQIENSVITAEYFLAETSPGILLNGNIDSDIYNCDIEDYPFGLIYQSYNNLPMRETPTLTNTRVRSSAQSSRNELITGIQVLGYSGLDIDDCDIEDYENGIIFDNTLQREVSTLTMTNTRVRNSPDSSREGAKGILLNGFVAISMNDCDIEEFSTGIEYIGAGQQFPFRNTPTMTNSRVRNSTQSSRSGILGIYIQDLSTITLDGCDIDGFENGIEINYGDFRAESTPTLTNTRVRNSPDSSREGTTGIEISGSGLIAANINNCDIEDYVDGLIYIGTGEVFPTRNTPTMTNSRVRNSTQSSRTGNSGLTITDLSEMLIDNTDIDGYDIGIEINNEDGSIALTPTLTNSRVRNSPESSRNGTMGVSVNGFVSLQMDDCDIEDYAEGIAYYGDGQNFPTRATPTLTNSRVRTSPQSSRLNEKGIVIDNVSEVIIDSCEVEDVATGIEVNGGQQSTSTPTLTNNRVRTSPESSRSGSVGFRFTGNLNASLTACEIVSCDSAVVLMNVLSSDIFHNLMRDSLSTAGDIGIYCYSGGDNNIWNNTIYDYDTALEAQSTDIELFNNIFWNTQTSIVENQSDISSEYNDIEGGYSDNDFNVYPEFTAPQLADFSLVWNSPCIDAGNPDSAYNDPDGTIGDIGCFYYEQTTTLDVPNVTIASFDGSDITLAWEHTAGAIEYLVYSSDNPYSGFTLDTSGSFLGTSWAASISGEKKFFYVVGSNNVAARPITGRTK